MQQRHRIRNPTANQNGAVYRRLRVNYWIATSANKGRAEYKGAKDLLLKLPFTIHYYQSSSYPQHARFFSPT